MKPTSPQAAASTTSVGQIAERALPEAGERAERTVDSHVSRIRKKLGGEAAERTETVWGIGYRCAEEPP
ncbi:MAG: helix-turn-helix domain-containing protein [Myxococcota bacterium]